MWYLTCYSDNDYAGGPDSQKSVSGYVWCARNVPISWRSKAQRTVTLSSSEKEFVAQSEAVKEIMFVTQLMEIMVLRVEYPIIIWVNNVGATFMTKNITIANHSKCMDIWYKYVN